MERSARPDKPPGTKAKVAWVGLGKLGLPKAAGIVAAGMRVHGFDSHDARLRWAQDRQIATAVDPGTMLDLTVAASRGVGASARLAAQLRETCSALIATGEGDTDFIATVRPARRPAGLA